MRELLVLVFTAIGGCLGALAPVLVYRLSVPLNTPPRDDCPHCGAALPAGWRGWLRVDGRCRVCRSPLVSHRWVYPLLTGTGFAALGWRLPADDPTHSTLLVGWLLVVAVGLVLAGIDLSVHRLPLFILVASAAGIALLIVAGAALDRNPGLVGHAAAAAAVFAIVYLALAVAGPGLVGAGDVYLAALLGLLLGTGSLASILWAAVLPYMLGFTVTVGGLYLRRIQRNSHIAFGPYLIAGAVLAKALIPV